MPEIKEKTKKKITESDFKPTDRVFFHWNSTPEPKAVDFDPEYFDNNDDDDPEAA